jgi:hypothetical protein
MQAVPVRIADQAIGTPDTQTAETPQNKYKWAEFAGLAGERYLEAIVEKILPFALHRTWRDMVRYQIPGRECYVGAARVSREAAKVSERKLYLDLEELRNRGLLKTSYARRVFTQDDGSVRVETVAVKDFEALYDLAHEYHQWCQDDPGYLEPCRDNREFILADPQLTAKVMRFDDYRRILCCRKPGPKAKPKTQHLWYTCQLGSDGQSVTTDAPTAEGAQPAAHHGTSDPKVNLYLQEQLIKDSPKRVDVMGSRNDIDDSNLRGATAPTQKEEFSSSTETYSHIAHAAICNTAEERKDEDELEVQGNIPGVVKEVEEEKNAKDQGSEGQRGTNETPATIEEQAAQAAGIPVAQWRELARRYGTQVAGRGKPRKVIVPLFIAGIIEIVSKMLCDQEHIASNQTQAANVYHDAHQLNEQEFTSCLYQALTVTQEQQQHGRVKQKAIQYYFGVLRGVVRDELVKKALTFEPPPQERSEPPSPPENQESQSQESPEPAMPQSAMPSTPPRPGALEQIARRKYAQWAKKRLVYSLGVTEAEIRSIPHRCGCPIFAPNTQGQLRCLHCSPRSQPEVLALVNVFELRGQPFIDVAELVQAQQTQE